MTHKVSAVLFLATGYFLGCTPQIDNTAKEFATQAPIGDTAKIAQIKGASKLTEDRLRAFEEKYRCKLPEDYRRFLLQFNGGFPTPDCVTFKEDGRTTASDVFCLHCIGDERPWASLEWHHETFSGRLPADTLPIGHDSCGNLWLLNVGSVHGGAVVFWDHGSFDTFDEASFEVWPRVAKSFQEFISNLCEYQPLPEETTLQSRYTLVQMAIKGMKAKTPAFRKDSVLDFAWHCHYNEDGSVTMQCVKYAIHAAVIHTDGYSDLRAAKGLIKAGPTRLPQ